MGHHKEVWECFHTDNLKTISFNSRDVMGRSTHSSPLRKSSVSHQSGGLETNVYESSIPREILYIGSMMDPCFKIGLCKLGDSTYCNK